MRRWAGLVGLGLVFAVADARADGAVEDVVAVRHPSKAAYTTGVVLTSVGASFLGTAVVGETVAGVVGAFGYGIFGLAGGLAYGALIAVPVALLGVSTLIPGIVLMGHNRPLKMGDDLVVRDAHATPPLPAFTSVPILSAQF